MGAVLSQDRKNILLVKRADVPVWVLPGGGIEASETPQEAIVREIKEETGLDVQIQRKVATYTGKSLFIRPMILFELSLVEGCITPDKKEVVDCQFFPFQNLPREIPPTFPEFFEDIQSEKDSITRTLPPVTWWIICKCCLQHPILSIRFLLSKAGMHVNTKPNLTKDRVL